MLIVASKIQGAAHGISLEVIEPMELFKDNYKDSNLADVTEATNQSQQLDAHRDELAKVKKVYLNAWEEADVLESKINEMFNESDPSER